MVVCTILLYGAYYFVGRTTDVKPDTFGENPSAQKWFESYLWVGETVMDSSVAFFGSSSYFERKR
ncbi:unnamed protein product [Alternaria alternata]